MYKRLYLVLGVFISEAMLLSACGSPAASSSPAASGSTTVSSAPNTDTAKSDAPAKASNAFKYYTSIDIGMTKDEAEKKLSLTAKEDTSDYVPTGYTGFYYTDADGEGVYVLYDKDSKLTSKTVQYQDIGAALSPFTSKPVTEELCDKITDGMSHAEVVKLLGSEGVECSKTLSIIFKKESLGTIYRWGNPDGSGIQVVFLSDDTAKNALYFD